MATAKTYHSRYLPTDRSHHIMTTEFDFNESDLYSESSWSVKSSPVTTTTTKKTVIVGSLPMNVSKNRRSIGNDDVEEFSGRVPPHEYLAKTRVASFSVHEGVGRTLKGRDLSRVRNAIFEVTGFLD